MTSPCHLSNFVLSPIPPRCKVRILSSLKLQPLPLSLLYFRAHSNGSIRRGFKTDTSEAVTMRSGLGVNLKDVTVFNRGREKGREICFTIPSTTFTCAEYSGFFALIPEKTIFLLSYIHSLCGINVPVYMELCILQLMRLSVSFMTSKYVKTEQLEPLLCRNKISSKVEPMADGADTASLSPFFNHGRLCNP